MKDIQSNQWTHQRTQNHKESKTLFLLTHIYSFTTGFTQQFGNQSSPSFWSTERFYVVGLCIWRVLQSKSIEGFSSIYQETEPYVMFILVFVFIEMIHDEIGILLNLCSNLKGLYLHLNLTFLWGCIAKYYAELSSTFWRYLIYLLSKPTPLQE